MAVPDAPAAPPAVLTADPARTCLLTDFDGTLSPIVEDPARAEPLPEAVAVLHGLAARYGRVAVVSGRPAAFLIRQLDLAGEGVASGLMAVGAYGLETACGDKVASHPAAEEWRVVVAEAADRAEREAEPGVFVERKGISFTLHYRAAPAAGAWCRRWAATVAAETGLAVHPARMSEELRPPVAVDKGTVTAELASGFGAACFMGDDRGDLPAFAALERLERGFEDFTAVRVAVRSSEVPAELLERADLVVDGPPGALSLLRSLL